jgi:plastocyanin
MKKIITILFALIVIGGIVAIVIWKNNKVPVPVATVFISKEGFNPKEVTIKKGDSVEFINSAPQNCSPADASCNFWPASDPHPTHTIYPEFDPREPLAPGESWVFIFKVQGDWGYHDHFKSRNRGIVHVLP